jgi:hypothetical protein
MVPFILLGKKKRFLLDPQFNEGLRLVDLMFVFFESFIILAIAADKILTVKTEIFSHFIFFKQEGRREDELLLLFILPPIRECGYSNPPNKGRTGKG